MSSFSWGCTDTCAELSWNHIYGQLAVAAIPWTLMTASGVTVGCLFPSHVKEARRKVTQYEYGLTSSSSASGTAVMSVCLLHIVVFAMRSADHTVDPIYHAMEMIGTLIVALDSLAHFTFVCTYGWRNVLMHACTRLVIDCLVMTSMFAVGISDGKGKTWFSFCYLAALRMMRSIECMRGQDAFNSRGSWRRQIIYTIISLGLFVYAASAVVLTLEHLGNPSFVTSILGKNHDSIYHLDSRPYEGKPFLGVCQGDCDADSDCIGDLICFQREQVPIEDCANGGDCPTGFERVPYCQELGIRSFDYCYDPNKPEWLPSQAILFIFTSFLTLGNSPILPYTVLGRMIAIGMTFVGIYMMSNLLGPTILNLLLNRNLGSGHFTPKKTGGHVVVVGTPTGTQLADFLHEIFHQNHFDGIAAFDREAPDVVVLLPSAATLSQLVRILAHKDSMLFRKRVTILKGEPFNLPDLERSAVDQARMVIVLPNLVVADVAADDSANIMRAFSLGSAVPQVRVQCLLHRSDNDPGTLSGKGGSGNLHFGCIDSYKMSLIAKACLTKGSLALVMNLCKTIGSSDTTNMKAWQRDYEHSIGGELYELPLSVNYHGESFGDIFLDIMARAVVGEVFMLGVIEPDEELGEIVRIHPGHDYVIDCDEGTTSGIFIAPDVGAIQQRGEEEDDGFWDRFVPRQAAFDVQSPREKKRGADDKKKEVAAIPEFTLPGGMQLPKGVTFDATSMSFAELLAAAEEAMRVPQSVLERRFAEKKYAMAMKEIKSRLLVGGVNVEHVGNIAETLLGDSKKTAEPSIYEDLLSSRSLAKKKIQELVEQISIKRPAELNEGSLLYNSALASRDEIIYKTKVSDQMAKIALHGALPNVNELGGHILLCIVSDTTANIEHLTTLPDGIGPASGIAHFMKPLRDDRFKGPEFRPAVIVLADALPSDWSDVLEHDRTYFVRGSPLDLADLESAGFREAKTIAIVRGHMGGHVGCHKVADARVLVLTTLIESNLPRSSTATIITDLSFDGSCCFLPASRVSVHGPKMGPAVAVPKHIQNLSDLFSDDVNEPGRPAEEDYESLVTLEYAHHHRFMTGQVFIASSMTALVANTFYNPSLLGMVDSLMQAPMILLPLPAAWEKKTYALLVAWLLKKRNLLALGLIRSAQAAEAGAYGANLDESIPTHHYVFTGPPAYKTLVVKTDRILCLAPTRVKDVDDSDDEEED